MKIGIFVPSGLPLSARHYTDNIISRLMKMGNQCSVFNANDKVPTDVDMYWDPRSMGGSAPYEKLGNMNKPLVVTVHGASPLAIPLKEHYLTFRERMNAKRSNKRNLNKWALLKAKCNAFISVSVFGKKEIAKYLCLDENLITPIWHGVDLNIFKPSDDPLSRGDYFLHVSQYQAIKNIDRIMEAYGRLANICKPKLLLVVPGFPQSKPVPHGVEVIAEAKTHKELANLYRGALALVNCSLRESFGMPIIEAMAVGCPVITSNNSALAEISGNSALQVNPRSVDDIYSAMELILADDSLRKILVMDGLTRAQQFTWERSVISHVKVFEWVIHKPNCQNEQWNRSC